MVFLLLEAGANTHWHIERDDQEVQATELARRNGHIAITELIEDWEKPHSCESGEA